MSRIALVTGAGGFLGRHLIPELASRGYEVRGLYRREEQAAEARRTGVEPFLGDVTDPATLVPAVIGATHVFHLAALLGGYGSSSELDRVNRGGTENTVEACLYHAPGLERFVLVSSIAVIGISPGGGAFTERTPPRPATAYGRSKLAQERVCAARAGLPWCAVRPPLLYGPGDRLTLPLFKWAARGFFPIFSGGLRRLSLLNIEDAARATARAGEATGIEGRRILLTGPESVTTTGLRAAMQRALGRRVREVRIPIPLVVAVAEALSPFVDAESVRQLRYPRREADPAEGLAHLGFTARIPLEEGVAEAVRWYREAGWLPGLR